MADTNGFYKFVILLYKGLLLRKRHFIATIFEFIIPMLFASIPVIGESESSYPPPLDAHPYWMNDKPNWIDEKTYPPYNPLEHNSFYSHYIFVYAPLNNNTHALVENAVETIKIYNDDLTTDIEGLRDANDLENYCMALQRNKTLIVIGTVFNNIHSESLPSDLDYSIRYADENFYTDLKYRFGDSFKYSVYQGTYFLAWQAAVEKAFIQKKMTAENETFNYTLLMRELLYPRHRSGSYRGVDFKELICLMMTYGFFFFVLNLTARVIEEKANGSRELLKMMGMTDFIYWCSTFLNYFLPGAIVILIITILYKCSFKNSAVLLAHSNFLLLFIIFLIFFGSLILFSLALTTFFNRALFGVTAMVIIYNISFILLLVFIFPLGNVSASYYPLSFLAKFCICLIPLGAILTISEIIVAFETFGEGLHWSLLYNSEVIPDFNISCLIIAMLLSCFIYIVLLWYVDAVWPWKYGSPKPFYFLFTKSYWFGYEEKSVDDILLNAENKIINEDFFEDDPTGMAPGVKINNLSKVFRERLQTKIAVNNISLNIYNGQITALLGPNGAGKTTIINMLIGLCTPTAGTASINGWNVFTQTAKARQSVGVCLQHDTLYDTLTVEEHLKLYAVLKGVNWHHLSEEVNSVLSMLNLVNKKNELAKNLSGGMKRKLSLGIAFIGGSKVLFLDEPTSGMDVEARRAVWDTMLSIRHSCTIILTTHYMEEADILGDRIAIMVNGEIQCCGSPLFLKNKFGTGYHLHLVKEQKFDLNTVNDTVKKFIPSAIVENEYEKEVTFNLMSNNEYLNFGALFEEIESKKNILGINSCGITVTTMEDVFLNVTNLSHLKIKLEDSSLENAVAEMRNLYLRPNEFGEQKQRTGNQLWALFLKRFHYTKRYWHGWIPQLILPFIIMCFCFFVINTTSNGNISSEPPLKYDIKRIYGETDGFYHSDDNPSSKLIASELAKIFQENNINAKFTKDPDEFVRDYGKKSMSNYYKRLIISGSATEQNLTAWFNGFPFHAEPLSLLLMDTAILRRVSKSSSIVLTNAPLPRSHTLWEDPLHVRERIIAMVFIPLALSFMSASFVLVPIHERTSKAKLLQLMTGISSATYWLAMFAWDFLMINSFVTLVFIIPFAIFSHYVFFSPHSDAIGTAIFLMVFYGWSAVPFSYLFSFIFKKPNAGFSAVTGINVILGIPVAMIFHFIPKSTKIEKVSWFLKLFPSYALSSGFSNLFAIAYSNAYCDSISSNDLNFFCALQPSKNPILKCCKDVCGSQCFNETYPITMESDACGRDILLLFLDGILYFLLLLLVESSFMKVFLCHCCQHFLNFNKISHVPFANGSFIEDPDVLQEEERVRSNYEQLLQDDALVVLNLSKSFKNVKAVDHLTFGIHKKECFGLLGVNGAGKTTTFKMIVGDCYPTEGNAHIGKYSIINNLKKFQSYIGYCPQFDALIDQLSAREMITLFARLRGLSGSNIDNYVNALIKMTDLTQYADKPSIVYSGGNKRKLSVAIALTGAPPLLLLDEPTTGIDPVSRRKIWEILSLAQIHSGAAVILSTHSMEESEALCNRIAIMVNGRFRCLGSIQQLKTKFGQGYTLLIKIKKEEQSIPQSINAVKAFIDTNFPGANLKDDHQGMLQYHIVDSSVTFSYLFKFMDDMKETYNLEDYVISDTSLEQIFLAFARAQRDIVA